jgi:hypothetical protein
MSPTLSLPARHSTPASRIAPLRGVLLRGPAFALPRVLAPFLASLAASAAPLTAQAAEGLPLPDWLCKLNASVRDARTRRLEKLQALQNAPAPLPGQTVPQLGYLHPHLKTPPTSPPWIQVDLGESYPIDAIALLPALADWQASSEPAYGFPRRFSIEASQEADLRNASLLARVEDSSGTDSGIAPRVFPGRGTHARYVRVTFSELAQDQGEFFCALGELMVLRGQRNLAAGRSATGSATVEIPNRWSLSFLTDGKSPLGPPVEQQAVPDDGVTFGPEPDGRPAHFDLQLNLPSDPKPLQEVRLHPIQARTESGGAGWAFPKRFSVQLSEDAAFTAPVEISPYLSTPCPNPGNHAVCLPIPASTAPIPSGFVRISLLEPGEGAGTRFGFSEVEVFSDDYNIALGGLVHASPDPASATRPASLLVDGLTSSGKLLPWPQWFGLWQKRQTLEGELALLEGRTQALEAELQQRWTFAVALLGLVLAASGAALFLRLLRKAPISTPLNNPRP